MKLGSTRLERPGFECAACKAVLPLFLVAVGKDERDALPDPFLAKCSFCGHRGAYPKSSIARDAFDRAARRREDASAAGVDLQNVKEPAQSLHRLWVRMKRDV